MFDTIAEMLRGSAPDDLAHALGTDRTQTRRAMEIGLPALITGLRDKTLEPGGAQNLASMLGEPGADLPVDLDAYLSAGDPAQGAAMLDVAFGDRGEPALGALSSASGLSTRLLAQVMSVLAPLATGVIAGTADHSPEGLRGYLAEAVGDLEAKGFGRVVELVSPELPGGGELPGLPGAYQPPAVPELPERSEEPAGNVVQGVFPEADELVMLDNDEPIDFGDPIVSDDPARLPSFAMPAPAVEVGSVEIAGPPAQTQVADPVLTPYVETQDDFKGTGLSSMGWLWWVIGAVLGLAVLLFAITQCGGDDNGVATTDSTEATPGPEATPDPAVQQRQAALDAILVAYPGVQGQVIGDVAVLNGTVADETERAVLDQAVRSANLGVQNNVTVAAAAPGAGEGYSINDLIDAQPELSTLRALLDQAGLGEALDGGGAFTLFAPTNDAFAAMQTELTDVQGDPEALKALLQYHLLADSQDMATISQSPSLTSMQGEAISVTVDNGTVFLNGTVPVLVGDNKARNGLLHIVSGVLIPPSSATLPAELGVALGLAPITFGAGSSDLTAEGKAELDKVVTFLLATPANIEIEGHTDSDGDTALNQRLSQDRADAVKTYLTDQGIPAESLTAVGYGEDDPIAPNDTGENKAKNRRIEFTPI